MSAAKKKRAVEEPEVERVITRDAPRSLDDVVTALAQARTDAGAIRKAAEPIVFAYAVAIRGERFVDWAIHCEWRGDTLRFVVNDAQGDEVDLRAITLPGDVGLGLERRGGLDDAG